MSLDEIVRFDNYVHASPRYNAVLPFMIDGMTKEAENYTKYDTINGTADKFFPCYSLLKSPNYQYSDTFIIDELGLPGTGKSINRTQPTINSFFSYNVKYNSSGRTVTQGKTIGAKNTKGSPVNSNLSKQTLNEINIKAGKLNPGWCMIEPLPIAKDEGTTATITDIPIYLIRPLGNNESIKLLYATNLGDKDIKVKSNFTFLENEIIYYKGYNFRCLKETHSNQLPIVETVNGVVRVNPIMKDTWELLNFPDNVFQADVFAFVDGKLVYFKLAQDPVRKFNPAPIKDPKTGEDKNSNLVCWAVGYYQ